VVSAFAAAMALIRLVPPSLPALEPAAAADRPGLWRQVGALAGIAVLFSALTCSATSGPATGPGGRRSPARRRQLVGLIPVLIA
jgi:hypothetical protein